VRWRDAGSGSPPAGVVEAPGSGLEQAASSSNSQARAWCPRPVASRHVDLADPPQRLEDGLSRSRPVLANLLASAEPGRLKEDVCAGGRDRFRICGLCRVKARSSGFASLVNRCETVADLYVRCLLLSLAVPRVPPIRGPSAAPRQPLVGDSNRAWRQVRPLGRLLRSVLGMRADRDGFPWSGHPDPGKREGAHG
jgi:hypothetical protein